MDPRRRLFAPTLILLSLFLSFSLAEGRPEVLQELDGFNRPVAAVFSPDGKFLFVVNHAEGPSGTLRSQSFLSRLTVDGAGKATPEQMKFVDALTAPIDLDFSPIRFGNVPAGAIFLLVGSPLVQDEAGRALKDLSRVVIGLQIVDPKAGRVIKTIDLGPNSKIRLRGEDSLLAPSSICFDKAGNLYIGESGYAGHMFERRVPGHPGIWRLEASAVAELVNDARPVKVELIRTTSLPNDMSYRKSDDSIYFVTNHTQGRPTGSIFMFDSGGFKGIDSMLTIARELPALSSVQLTPSGRALLAGVNGELMFPKGKRDARPVRFRPQLTFSAPGKIATLPLADGGLLVAVPEQSSDAGAGKGQRLRLVKLPSGY